LVGSEDDEGPSSDCKVRDRNIVDGYALFGDYELSCLGTIWDPKRRILDCDSPGMSRVVKDAREGDVMFESSSSESTILRDGSTAAQGELWKFFGEF